jgi:hypothetical protein
MLKAKTEKKLVAMKTGCFLEPFNNLLEKNLSPKPWVTKIVSVVVTVIVNCYLYPLFKKGEMGELIFLDTGRLKFVPKIVSLRETVLKFLTCLLTGLFHNMLHKLNYLM